MSFIYGLVIKHRIFTFDLNSHRQDGPPKDQPIHQKSGLSIALSEDNLLRLISLHITVAVHKPDCITELPQGRCVMLNSMELTHCVASSGQKVPTVSSDRLSTPPGNPNS